MGHLLSTDFDYESSKTSLSILGDDNGYQHLWKEAEGSSANGIAQVTWFGGLKFYTQTSAANDNDQLIFARPGANDPLFNLRNDQVLIHRKKDEKDVVYASVIESHGSYSTVTEIPQHPFGDISTVEVVYDDKNYTVIGFGDDKNNWKVFLCNEDASESSTHSIEISNSVHTWEGPFKLIKE